MATLITGAGLVGSSFARCAARRQERLVFFDSQPREEYLRIRLGGAPHFLVRGDVRDLPALIRAIQDHAVDTVVHTAGLIGRRVAESLATSFAVNVGGATNVAEAVRLCGVRRLVHVSSTGVYDWRKTPDRAVAEDFPRGSGGPYSNFNVAKELVMEAYALQHGFELVMIRSASVIGLGHGWSGSSGARKLFALVEAGLRGVPARIPAAQAGPNEYVCGEDLGRAIELAATLSIGEDAVFNVAGGTITSFDELVSAAQKAMPGLEVEIVAGERPPGRTQAVDISRAKRRLGWAPEVGLAHALEVLAEELRSIGVDGLERLRR